MSARIIPEILKRHGPGERQYHAQPTATISVGGDDWANQVINNVVGSEAISYKSNLKEKINEKKRKFHADRCLELKNLPDGATEQEIRLALPDVDMIRIEIDRMDVPHRPGAKLYLKNPHILDNWPQHRDSVYVRNKEVNLCLGTSDKWLCLARLPFHYTEQDLTDLVSKYGKVKHSFLVCSQVTGESKGYGLVKFQTHEGSNLARQFLNGKMLEGEAIQVDWLNSSFIQYSQLHSKCLYVSNLPKNFRDLALFRRIFSVVKNPPYCQIAMKNGVLQDWGLVEFFDENDAEKTQQEIHGYELQGVNLQVYYCIPGVNAINIYMSLVTSPDSVSERGLVDEVPDTTVYAQLNKLATQNPAFAQNLQKIIQNQVEKVESSTGGSSPPDNPHDQAALIILMAAQHQAEKEGSSLLQNQEVLDVLQNLVCARNQYGGEQVDPYAQLMRIPSLQSALTQQATRPEDNLQNSSKSINSPPPVIANNLNLLSNTETLNEMLGSLKSGANNEQNVVQSTYAQPLAPNSLPDMSKPPPVLIPSGLPPPVLPRANQFLVPPPPPPAPPVGRLPDIPVTTVISAPCHVPEMSSPQGIQSPTLQLALPSSVHQGHVLASPPPQQPSPFTLKPNVMTTSALPTLPGVYLPGLDGLLTPPVQPLQSPIQPGSLQASLQPQLIYPPPNTLFYNPLTSVIPGVAPVIPQLPGYPHINGVPNLSMAPNEILTAGPGGLINTSEIGLLNPPAMVPQVVSTGSKLSLASPTIPITSTPVASKRKASIPPSPEDSPGGRPYIGQHSQGLGGHYADSYMSSKRSKYR